MHIKQNIFALCTENTSTECATDLEQDLRHVKLPNCNLCVLHHSHSTKSHCGFTLVELLIAMTITLLMMAALGKAFAVIGASMKDGRSKVTLSSRLRGISFRMRSDLGARTAKAKPPITSTSGEGYFMYYEGPLTEQTFGLYAADATRETSDGTVLVSSDTNFNDASNGPTYRRFSRYGDTDDYLAFTAKAPGEDWFTGKVPRYLVDDTVDANGDGVLNASEQFDAMQPQVIRSKYAEIVLWASPAWDVDSSTNVLQVNPGVRGMPLYKDLDNNYVPDKFVIHRRVLLIRPDLNLQCDIPASPRTGGGFSNPCLRPLLSNTSNPGATPTALANVYPIGSGLFPNYVDPASSGTTNSALLTSNWLVGMAQLHHFFDVSLRRVIHPDTGEPTSYVAANSLQDLVQPHNRFAHVRYPGRYFGRGVWTGPEPRDNATSMPLLAVGWNDAIVDWQGSSDVRNDPSTPTVRPTWLPISHPAPNTLKIGNASTNQHGLFNGWLLPHFELGDANPAGSSAGSHWERGYLTARDTRWDRSGEDIIASNALAFDVKGFDPNAPLFITSGADGEPGQAGVNDDVQGTGTDADDKTVIVAGGASSELGAAGSDDDLVSVNDVGIYDLCATAILDLSNPATFTPAPPTVHHQSIASRGGFVDIFFPYLAGTALRNRTTQTSILSTPRPAVAATPTALVNSNYTSYFSTALSGYPIPPTSLDSLKRSGKLVHNGSLGAICFLQPTYDTWTDAYETDGFDQSQTVNGAVIPDTTASEIYVGTTWLLNNSTGLTKTPRILAPVAQERLMQIDTRRFAASSPETSPPIETDLNAISVTVRIDDPGTQEMTEFTIVETLN